jgi:hypothetical protein
MSHHRLATATVAAIVGLTTVTHAQGRPMVIASATGESSSNSATGQTALRLISDVAADTTDTSRTPRTLLQESPYEDPVSKRGQQARGLYITASYARVLGTRGVIQTARANRMDAVVIDLKNDYGQVTFSTEVPELKGQSRPILRDVGAMVRELHEADLYVIARIVCFKDHLLPQRDPSRAIADGRPGKENKLWVSKGRTHWLDPYNRRNHDTLAALAKEVAAFGFDELQFDYIRFPVDSHTEYARYRAANGISRPLVIRDFLKKVDELVSIPIGVDIFGLTAFHKERGIALGQSPEAWAPYVEVFSPMLYLNNMKSWGSRGANDDRAGRLIQEGVAKLRERVGLRPVIRPFLQAFRPGADHYDTRFIVEQVQGARIGGSDGYLFWNPGSRYGLVGDAVRSAPANFAAFDVGSRSDLRAAKKTAMTPSLKNSESKGDPHVKSM